MNTVVLNTVVLASAPSVTIATVVTVFMAVVATFLACCFICRKRYIAFVVSCSILLVELIFWINGTLIPSFAIMFQWIAEQFVEYFSTGEQVFMNKIWLIIGVLVTVVYHYAQRIYRMSMLSIHAQLVRKEKVAEESFHEGVDLDSARGIIDHWHELELEEYEKREMHMNCLAFLVFISRVAMFLTIPVCLIILGICEQIFTRIMYKVWGYGNFSKLKLELQKRKKLPKLNMQYFERIIWAIICSIEVGAIFLWNTTLALCIGGLIFVAITVIFQMKTWQWADVRFPSKKTVKPKA